MVKETKGECLMIFPHVNICQIFGQRNLIRWISFLKVVVGSVLVNKSTKLSLEQTCKTQTPSSFIIYHSSAALVFLWFNYFLRFLISKTLERWYTFIIGILIFFWVSIICVFSKWRRCRFMEGKANKYKNLFDSETTWLLIREEKPVCNWSKGVWFHYVTPKCSFMVWTTIKDRLATLERMAKWNGDINTTCSLCQHQVETRNHLFFFHVLLQQQSGQVWQKKCWKTSSLSTGTLLSCWSVTSHLTR